MDDFTPHPPRLHPRRETLDFLRAYARKRLATGAPAQCQADGLSATPLPAQWSEPC